MNKVERKVLDEIINARSKHVLYKGSESCRKIVDKLLQFAKVNKLSQVDYVFNLTRERSLKPYAFVYRRCKHNKLNDRYAVIVEKDNVYYVAELGGQQPSIIYTVDRQKSTDQKNDGIYKLKDKVLVPGFVSFVAETPDGEVVELSSYIDHTAYNKIYVILKNKDKLSKDEWQQLLLLIGAFKAFDTDDQLTKILNSIPESFKPYVKYVIMKSAIYDRYKDAIIGLLKLIERLKQNPVGYIIDQLADFLANGKLPITKDGTILAYKKVNRDFTSIWDNRTLNSPGSIVELDLEQCDTNPNSACSSGLHVCSFEYLPMFGVSNPEHVRIVVCEIAPEDVVAVPKGEVYKMRCRRYKVLYDVTQEVLGEGKDILRSLGFVIETLEE